MSPPPPLFGHTEGSLIVLEEPYGVQNEDPTHCTTSLAPKHIFILLSLVYLKPMYEIAEAGFLFGYSLSKEFRVYTICVHVCSCTHTQHFCQFFSLWMDPWVAWNFVLLWIKLYSQLVTLFEKMISCYISRMLPLGSGMDCIAGLLTSRDPVFLLTDGL